MFGAPVDTSTQTPGSWGQQKQFGVYLSAISLLVADCQAAFGPFLSVKENSVWMSVMSPCAPGHYNVRKHFLMFNQTTNVFLHYLILTWFSSFNAACRLFFLFFAAFSWVRERTGRDYNSMLRLELKIKDNSLAVHTSPGNTKQPNYWKSPLAYREKESERRYTKAQQDWFSRLNLN